MTTIETFDFPHPLRLATGSHPAGSGKGCAMNVLSYENGDTTITDMPGCVDRVLAQIVQRVNDSICTHRDGDLLCPACSIAVLDLAHRTVGTGLVELTALERRQVWVWIAADQARQVAHLNRDARVMAAIVSAEAWAGDPSKKNAACAANNAAACAANNAAACAAAYASADAANNAAAYASAAAADAALRFAHRAIDVFEARTGHRAPTIDEQTVTAALEAMACNG